MISKVEGGSPYLTYKSICFAISQMAFGKTAENIYLNEREKKLIFTFSNKNENEFPLSSLFITFAKYQ